MGRCEISICFELCFCVFVCTDSRAQYLPHQLLHRGHQLDANVVYLLFSDGEVIVGLLELFFAGNNRL